MVRLPVTGGVAVNAHRDFPRPLPGKQLPMTSHAEGSPARQNLDNAKQRKPVPILSSLVNASEIGWEPKSRPPPSGIPDGGGLINRLWRASGW